MIYLELFYVFFLIGLFTIGGGYAMIPLIESETMKRGWIEIMDFHNMVSIAESTPGPIAINIATFVGFNKGGIFGSIVATAGVILPSFVIILLIAAIFNKLIDNKFVKALLEGFKGAVVGLIIGTALFFFYQSVVEIEDVILIHYEEIGFFVIICAVAFIYKHFKKKNLSPYLILILSSILGVAYYFIEILFL